jgi:hypothetical protein
VDENARIAKLGSVGLATGRAGLVDKFVVTKRQDQQWRKRGRRGERGRRSSSSGRERGKQKEEREGGDEREREREREREKERERERIKESKLTHRVACRITLRGKTTRW